MSRAALSSTWKALQSKLGMSAPSAIVLAVSVHNSF